MMDEAAPACCRTVEALMYVEKTHHPKDNFAKPV